MALAAPMIGWLLLLLVVLPADAATLRVPSEYPTINDGLDAAASGDTVLVAPGTYSQYDVRVGPLGTLESSIAFLKGGVTLLSEEGPGGTVIDMVRGEYSWIAIRGWQLAEEVWVEGFTVTGSLPRLDGMELREGAKGTVVNCIFRDIGTGDSGEHALFGQDSDLEVIDCEIRNISTGGRALGTTLGSSLLVRRSTFDNCSSGAIGSHGVGGESPTLTIEGSVFTSNAGYGGGALVAQWFDSVVIRDSEFRDNMAETGGGAVLTAFVGQVEVLGSVFVGNRAHGGGKGGAMRLDASFGSTESVIGNTFHDCSQDFPTTGGSAVRFQGHATATFLNNVVSSCSGAEAVSLDAGTAVSDCNVFWGNADGDLENMTMGPNDRVVDPELCAPSLGDVHLLPTSPCLPENSNGCGLIGALGQGCATGVESAIETMTWGRIKGIYRLRGDP